MGLGRSAGSGGGSSGSVQASTDGGWRSPVNQVLRNRAGQDPLSALAWINSQVDPSMQAHDIGQIIRQWSRDDESAAVSYVNNLGAGPARTPPRPRSLFR